MTCPNAIAQGQQHVVEVGDQFAGAVSVGGPAAESPHDHGHEQAGANAVPQHVADDHGHLVVVNADEVVEIAADPPAHSIARGRLLVGAVGGASGGQQRRLQLGGQGQARHRSMRHGHSFSTSPGTAGYPHNVIIDDEEEQRQDQCKVGRATLAPVFRGALHAEGLQTCLVLPSFRANGLRAKVTRPTLHALRVHVALRYHQDPRIILMIS